MKVLLRNTESRLYYVGNGDWTPDSSQARGFEQIELAIQFHRAERLTAMEVVLSYDDPYCDLVLPLQTDD
jgi:hypothetical protein